MISYSWYPHTILSLRLSLYITHYLLERRHFQSYGIRLLAYMIVA